MTHPDIEQMRKEIEEARKAFRAKAREILFIAYQDADRLSLAVGDASVDQVFDAWLAGVVLLITRAVRQAHPEETSSIAAVEQWINDMEKKR